ncbi:MAG: hypothetical protein E7403_02455 [Ruminococcaceae bacterium]|nr:hypothetical protein [Oscillospiraceae bacterium]
MEPVYFGDRLATFYDVSTQEKDYIRSLADEYFKKEAKEKANLKTKEDVINRRKKVQAAFKKAVGILPDRHAPLHIAYCNEHLLEEGITLQNLTFDSLPGLKVTASLWLPKGHADGKKHPAVMVAVGHSPMGRAHDTYVMLCRMLARNGMVVLSCDPPGQYERVQYPDENGKSRIGGAVAEHFQIGFPCHLTGLTLAAFFVRDLERGLDVLETLPYVDKHRIAIAGNSGGGMMSALMALWDDRLAAVAPACFITSRQAALLGGRPQDPEQIVPRVIEEGINHDDFVSLFAPKPHLICAADYDGIDIYGAVFTHERAKNVYRLFDAEENARFYSAPTGHGLFEGQRKAITEFLSEVLSAPVKTVGDVNPPLPPLEWMMATKTGCLLTDDSKAKTIYDCYNDYYNEKGYTDCDRQELKKRVLEFLRLPVDMENRPELKHPRYISNDVKEGIRNRKIWFFSEGETDFTARRIAVCGVLYEPENGAKNCVVLVPEDEDGEQYQERFLKEGKAVFRFYPRGIGALKSLDAPGITMIRSAIGKILSPEYRRNCDLIMCGTSTAALRTYDVVRAVDFMRKSYDNVTICGMGTSSLYALLAASVTDVTAQVFEVPVPYAEYVQNKEYDRKEREEVFGILEYFDIPLLIDKLAEK